MLTVLLDKEGKVVSAVGVPRSAPKLSGHALDTVLSWARRTDQRAVSFLWLQQVPGPGYRVQAEIDYELGSSVQVSVSVDPLQSLPYDLTVRELEVLTLLVAGLKNAELADRLTVSVRTVATHVDRIMAKMGVASRTAAATIALDEGLLVVPLPGGESGFERLDLGRALSPTQGVPSMVSRGRRLARSPIRLGAALPLVGETAEDGLEMLRGTQPAVDQINRRGGINRRSIELVVAELDHMDASTIAPALNQLAEADVDAVTSGYLARQDLAHELAAEFGRPYLNAATLSEMVRRVQEEPRYRRIFQVCPGDAHYAPRFVNFMTELRDTGRVVFQSRKLIVLLPAWPPLIDLGLVQGAEAAERGGWEFETFPLGTTAESWDRAAAQVRAAAPAAVLIGNYFVSGTIGFLTRILADTPPTLFYALYAPSVPAWRYQMGDSAEGLLWATVSGTYSDTPATQFAQRYHEAYGRPPDRSHAGISYDRVNILVTAWTRVPDPRDFDAVASEIRSFVHRGVNGSYWLGEQGQAALAYPDSTLDPSLGQAHLIYQIQNGRHRIISPVPYTESVFRVPPWMMP